MTRIVRCVIFVIFVPFVLIVVAQSPPVHELAPTGTLRVAIGVGAANSAFWASRDPATSRPRGVTVDLANALSQALGIPLELVIYTNSGDVTDAGPKGEWDVSFLPADDERARIVDFGPAYVLSESTYLVPAGSAIQRFEEVDRHGVRVAGIANTATGRSAGRVLKNATLLPFRTQEELLASLRTGDAGAIALSREALTSVLPQLPGARILDGSFHQAEMAVAVPKGHRAALAYVTRFVEDAKAAGVVRRALDRAGLPEAIVAPAGR
jgi:polar amino acid transport system substrate-binding protein